MKKKSQRKIKTDDSNEPSFVSLLPPSLPFLPSASPSLSVLLFMPIAKDCNFKTALAFPEPGGMCIRTWIFPQGNHSCLLVLLSQKQQEQAMGPAGPSLQFLF